MAPLPNRFIRYFVNPSVAGDLFARVDQTWSGVTDAPAAPSAAHEYVQAVSAVSEAVLEGLRADESLDVPSLPDLDALVSTASLAPVVERTRRPWRAVVGAALDRANVDGLPAIEELVRVLRWEFDENDGDEWEGGGDDRDHARSVMSPHDLAVAAQAITEELVEAYEPPLDLLRRVFQPGSDEELGRWLGVSRTTVSDWSTGRFSPSAERQRRLETVSATARLVDRYVHPEDQVRYLRSTPLPAFGDRTLEAVLTDDGPDARDDLNRAFELLRSALVQ